MGKRQAHCEVDATSEMIDHGHIPGTIILYTYIDYLEVVPRGNYAS
jgi:hypothetical protein